MSDTDWITVFHPDHYPFPKGSKSPWRGAWHLYVSPSDFPSVWEKVKKLTEDLELDYRSSYCQVIQPNGKYLICVSAMLLQVHNVKERLEEEDLGEFITEFKLTNEFRNKAGADAVLGMLPFLGYLKTCIEKSVEVEYGEVAKRIENDSELFQDEEEPDWMM